MPFQTTWDSIDQVPDWAKSDVLSKEGKYVLNVPGYRPKEDVDEFRTRNQRLQEELDRIQAQFTGALTAEDATGLRTQVQELQTQLESGVSEQKLQEALDKRTSVVRIGEKDLRVVRAEKPLLEEHLRSLTTEISGRDTREKKLLGELSKERLTGRTTEAYRRMTGYKANAEDDVVLHVANVFTGMSDDYQPFMPDLQTDPTGKSPKLDGNGKPVTIPGYLAEIMGSGKKAGVWFTESSGPSRRGTKPAPEVRTEPAGKTGAGRIREALEARRNFPG